MKTITKTFNIYDLSELSPKTQQKVLENWRNDSFIPWEDENTNTLDTFCKIFPCSWQEFHYGLRELRANYNPPESTDNMTPLRLRTYILNNYYPYLFKPKYLGNKKSAPRFTPIYSKISESSDCPLTGYFIDDDILSPLYDFIKKPYSTTFSDLLQKCLENWLSAVCTDYDYYNSQEGIIEDIESNGYHFLENGDIYDE